MSVYARCLLTATLLVGVLLPRRAYGQCVPQDGAMVSVAPAVISFSTPTIADYDNGAIVYQSTVRIDIDGRGTRRWSLCVGALTSDLGTSNGVTKPISDLEWQGPGGSWVPLSFAPQVVVVAQGDRSFLVNVRIRLSWSADPPGTFGTVIRFVVAG